LPDRTSTKIAVADRSTTTNFGPSTLNRETTATFLEVEATSTLSRLARASGAVSDCSDDADRASHNVTLPSEAAEIIVESDTNPTLQVLPEAEWENCWS
jgi:hypothetical protein